MPRHPRVFISYSHDSETHKKWVQKLADRLTQDGLEVALDQYVHPWPAEGWPLWMEKEIKKADFVLVVCTRDYLARYLREDPDGGRGVAHEGLIITQALYDNFDLNHKFIPVLPENGEIENIPTILRGGNHYRLWRDYEDLYRVLTNQPATSPPKRGRLKRMPPKPAGFSFLSSMNVVKWLTAALILMVMLAMIAWKINNNITYGSFSPIINGDINNSDIQIGSGRGAP